MVLCTSHFRGLGVRAARAAAIPRIRSNHLVVALALGAVLIRRPERRLASQSTAALSVEQAIVSSSMDVRHSSRCQPLRRPRTRPPAQSRSRRAGRVEGSIPCACGRIAKRRSIQADGGARRRPEPHGSRRSRAGSQARGLILELVVPRPGELPGQPSALSAASESARNKAVDEATVRCVLSATCCSICKTAHHPDGPISTPTARARRTIASRRSTRGGRHHLEHRVSPDAERARGG